MVGVPRSKGCRTCLRRRVKCDETRPACQRCETRGQQCPGYEKAPKFRHYSAPSGHSNAKAQPVVIQPHTWVHSTASPRSTSSIDECVAPNLACMALDLQQREVFGLFVDATFPGLYYAWSTRVDVTFMDFVRQQSDAPTDALVWGIRTLGTLHLGQQHQDSDKIACSRSMYGRGLRSLARLLQHPTTVKSDRTLGAAVLLAIYEMLDGMGHKSWLTHSNGIGTLFRYRGAEAHRDGFGRTLLISFRSFLIADALIRGEPCFLAETAWRSVIKDAVRTEGLMGKGSELGDLVEYAFEEITVCPGLVAWARAISTTKEADALQPQLLMKEIVRTRGRLADLHGQLEMLTCTSLDDKGLENRPDLTGPIPVEVITILARFSLKGLQVAISLLGRLLLSLEARQLPVADTNTSRTAPRSSETPRLTIMGDEDDSGRNILSRDRPPESPDHIALSMGMLVIE